MKSKSTIVLHFGRFFFKQTPLTTEGLQSTEVAFLLLIQQPGFNSGCFQRFILVLLRFIDGAGLRKVNRCLKMLIEPIFYWQGARYYYKKTLLITLDTYSANVLCLNLFLVLMIVLVFVQLTHVCFILSERVNYQQGIIPMTSSIPCAHKLTTKVRKTN